MKRIKNLYDEICLFENLLLAATKAQRGKRARVEISSFNHRIESELVQLQKELKEQSYRPGQFRSFPIRDPKPRIISAAPYRDRVVHHALCNVISPIFERSFIYDSYASRKGKGTHAAIDQATHFVRNNDYALQCDIRRYFPNVDHSILKELILKSVRFSGHPSD